MKNLSEKLQNSLYIFTGLILIILIFYNRVIRERLPKELFLFLPEVNYPLLFFIIISLFLSVNIIYYSIKIIYDIPIKPNFMTKYFSKISDIIDISFMKVYELLGFFTNDFYSNISAFSWNFYTLFKDIREDIFSLISYFIRILIVLIFLYDVFWNFKLYYFYKSLILLIIPIIKKIIFFILRDFANNINLAVEPLIITHINEDNYIISRAKGYEHISKKELDYCIQEYTRCSKIKGYLDEHRSYADYYLFRVNVLVYFLYLIGWLYVLYTNYILCFL